MKNFKDAMMIKAMGIKNAATNKVVNVLAESTKTKRKGIDGILVTIGLAIVAVMLLIVFKDKINTVMGNIIDNLNNKLAVDLFTNI